MWGKMKGDCGLDAVALRLLVRGVSVSESVGGSVSLCPPPARVRAAPRTAPSVLDDATQRVLVRLLVAIDERRDVLPAAGSRHIFHRQVLPLRCPTAAERMPQPAPGAVQRRELISSLQPVGCQVSIHRLARVPVLFRMREDRGITDCLGLGPEPLQFRDYGRGRWHRFRPAQLVVLRPPGNACARDVDVVPPQPEHGAEPPTRVAREHNERTKKRMDGGGAAGSRTAPGRRPVPAGSLPSGCGRADLDPTPARAA